MSDGATSRAFVVIGPNGVDRVSEHGEAIEKAIAACRSLPGSFVLEATAGVPMTQPTIGDALAQWRANRARPPRERRPPRPPRQRHSSRVTPAAAVAWLAAELLRGPVSSVELEERARPEGFAFQVRQIEVRRAAGAVVFRRGRHWWLARKDDLPADAVIVRRGAA